MALKSFASFGSRREFGALPIVMMTSYGSRVHDSAINAGCNEFLAKPIDFLALDGILHKFAPTN
jgi:CheY-like chemotaxis protein